MVGEAARLLTIHPTLAVFRLALDELIEAVESCGTRFKKPQSLDTIDFAALAFLFVVRRSGLFAPSDHYFDYYGTHIAVSGGFAWTGKS